jgi:hypothetical protein
VLTRVSAIFDFLEAAFESSRHRRFLAINLVLAFSIALVIIEVAAAGWLGPRMANALPHSHFHAIEFAFYLLLGYEVAGLVFAIPRSVANAAGKQFEIFSLILLRHSFDPFAKLDEPVRWEQAQHSVLEMLSYAGGGLLIFVGLGFYYAVQKHRPLSEDARDRESFIAAKKAISLFLLVFLAMMAARSMYGLVTELSPRPFFEPFYTVLIFADVMVVLISLRYSASYHIVFRNSGLAVGTVLLRVALSAPAPWISLLGVAAMLFVIGLSVAYHRFAPVLASADAH